MESCSAGDLRGQALPILQAGPQMFDSAVLLAGPVKDGTPPALVFECAAGQGGQQALTVRRPGDDPEGPGPEAIACTNHFRTRPGPRTDAAGYRYALIRSVLAAKARRQEKVDFTLARKAMGAARLPITVHTVVADLDTLDFWYAAGEFLSPPGERDFVKLPVKKWLGGE